MACSRCHPYEPGSFTFSDIIPAMVPVSRCDNCILDEAIEFARKAIKESPKGTTVYVERCAEGDDCVARVSVEACYPSKP